MRQKYQIARIASTLSAIFILAFTVALQPALAQEVSAGITGTVVDQGGAPVKAATITAKDMDRGTSLSAETKIGRAHV